MKSLRQGPAEILSHICINADLINTPALGDDQNVAYTATQLNIAPAQVRGSGKPKRLTYSINRPNPP